MALIDNLISYYALEANGNDSHGTNHLTNNNSVTFATGIIGNGADFEASSSQWLSIADASQTGLDFTDILTFAGWIKTESGTNHQFITKRVGTGNQRSYQFVRDAGANQMQLYTNTDGATQVITGVSWTNPTNGVWYHIAVTKTGTTVKFYLDGAQLGTTQTASSATIFNGTAPFEMGAFQTDPQYYDGMMDEWGFWNRALSDAEIAELYNAGAGLAYPFAAAGGATTPIPRMLSMKVG